MDHFIATPIEVDTAAGPRTIAGILNVETDQAYEIWPLGEQKDKHFVSHAAAVQLSERYAANANENGISEIPSLRKI